MIIVRVKYRNGVFYGLCVYNVFVFGFKGYKFILWEYLDGWCFEW